VVAGEVIQGGRQAARALRTQAGARVAGLPAVRRRLVRRAVGGGVESSEAAGRQAAESRTQQAEAGGRQWQARQASAGSVQEARGTNR